MVGIPRVERALVREALAAGHNVFVLDRRSRKPRLLSAHELAVLHRLLGEIASPAWTQSNRRPLMERWTEARRLIVASGGCAGAELERYLANMLAGDWRRRGWAYQSSKLLVRSCHRWNRHRQSRAARAPHASAILDDDANHVWLSSRTTHELPYAGLALRAKTYAILHDLIPLRGAPFFSPQQASRFSDEAGWMAENCRRIICPSNHTKQQAGLHFPDHAGKFATVHPAGLLRETARRLEAKMPRIPPDMPKRFAMYCATIEPRKNHALLIGVWRRLHAKLGADCPGLFLVGRWGWNCDEVAREIDAAREEGIPLTLFSGLGDSELIWLYRHAAFGLFPSLDEGFGLGVAECLDFGLPCFISDAPALAEAAQGLMPILPADSPERWFDALQAAVIDAGPLDGLRKTIDTCYQPRSSRDFFRDLADVMVN